MQKDHFDSRHDALMNTERVLLVKLHVNVVHIRNIGRILSQIPSLSFPVAIVVRGNDNHFLAQNPETDREFINHHTKTAHCGPPAKFRRTKYNRAKLALLNEIPACDCWLDVSL